MLAYEKCHSWAVFVSLSLQLPGIFENQHPFIIFETAQESH